jgi:hypothetical protein
MASRTEFDALDNYTDKMVKAGVMLGAESHEPGSNGAGVKFTGKKRTVTDGPFTEAKERAAG